MKIINILLVEDNEGDVLLTVDALRNFKLVNEVTVIRDGREALNYIEHNPKEPDLIILDVNLPKINGHEILKKIKSNDAKKNIPIIMLTTSSAPTDVLKSYQNHANCYISKPVDANDFFRVFASIETFWFSIVKLPKKA